MREFPRNEKILTAKEAAELLKVTVQTIKNYIYHGKIRAFKTPGGQHRILESELLKQLEALMSELKEDERMQAIQQAISEGERQIAEERANKRTKTSEDKETPVHHSQSVAVNALLKVLDKRQNFPWNHSKRVADYTNSIAGELGFSAGETKKIELAALLHDIGKIEISEDILTKTEKLSEEEFNIIKKHPELGENMVKGIEELEDTGLLIRSHHERFDGKGYPNGLTGEEIPIGSRMIAVAEIFDGLTSSFPFHTPLSREEAVDILKQYEGKQLDPNLVKKFIKTLK